MLATRSLTMRYSESPLEISKIFCVTPSGAGPPFDVLNLIPKSLSIPPGL